MMSLRNRMLVLLGATIFLGVVGAALSVIGGLVGAWFRHGHAEIGGNDHSIEWSLLVLGLLSCAAVYEIWKMMAEDRENSD